MNPDKLTAISPCPKHYPQNEPFQVMNIDDNERKYLKQVFGLYNAQICMQLQTLETHHVTPICKH